MPQNLILKKPTINWLNSIIPTSTRAIKPSSKKSQKLMKSCPTNKSRGSMTLHELSDKDGPKWAVKLSRVHTLIKSIKTFSIACRRKKENSFKDKPMPD